MFVGKHMRISSGEERPVPKGVAPRLLPKLSNDLGEIHLFGSRGHVSQRDPRVCREAFRIPVSEAREKWRTPAAPIS